MRLITRAELNGWLDNLAEKLVLVAPVSLGGKLVYRHVNDSNEIAWGFERTDMSPKTHLFPATEAVLAIEQGADVKLHPVSSPRPKVVFGVRPCDARGLLAIDALFLGQEPRDERYALHREATTLIGLSCSKMWESCFCTVVGGAPNNTDGLDILLTEVDDCFQVQVISEKGATLSASMPAQRGVDAALEPELIEGLPSLRSEDEWGPLFEEVLWNRVSDACIGCRACTFVCPTCRCFDVRDEVVLSRPGEQVIGRLRAWDACTGPGYRRIAGGHNPRPTQASRLRNRFYCKFVYYPQDYGPLGCVGCGRCVDACPVGVDILEVIGAVEKMIEVSS